MAAIGVAVVANFQETLVFPVHIAGTESRESSPYSDFSIIEGGIVSLRACFAGRDVMYLMQRMAGSERSPSLEISFT